MINKTNQQMNKLTNQQVKNRFLFFSLFLCLTVFLSSCEKKWKEPEFQIPKAPFIKNKTDIRPISNIKNMHTIGNPPDSIIPPRDRDIFIQGYVVSSDEGGNFFKSLVIQDKTGGIEIRLDKTGLYTEYPVGQKVFVDCRGLLIGDYAGYPQLGVLYEGGVGRLHQLLIPKHIYKDSLPDIKKMYKFLEKGYEEERPVKITNATEMAANVGKLVMIPDCRFDAASIGAPLAYNDIDYTSHTVRFGDTQIVLRTSSYAKFRNNVKCEDKPFTLFGVISIFGSTYQFTVRTADDVDYTNSGIPQPLTSFKFNEKSLTTGGWRVSNNESSTKWHFAPTDDRYMFHDRVLGTETRCDDWLISPPIKIEDRKGVNMFLDHRVSSSGGTLQDYYKVYYSVTDNGIDFKKSDWLSLGELSTFHSDFTLSNGFDISKIPNSTFRIAIQYNKYADAPANRWSIREIKFTR